MQACDAAESGFQRGQPLSPQSPIALRHQAGPAASRQRAPAPTRTIDHAARRERACCSA